MSEGRVQRRLAAILAADVVGYSRLVREDEEGTLAAVGSAISEVFSDQIERNNGRVFKTLGDGLLAEFPSVVDAVRCAVDAQQAMDTRNKGRAADRKIEFRVGINLGDIVADGDDLHGDGVNVASRLESLADPGGILISGSSHEQIRDKLNLDFEDQGEQRIKNIDRPVRVYRVVADGSDRTRRGPISNYRGWRRPVLVVLCLVFVSAVGFAVWQAWAPTVESASIDRMAFPLPDKPSVAVLPFNNMSDDPGQEYFVDGMTEDLITDLSKISSLFVIARNSVFTYKDKPVKVQRVAEELGVRYVLEGSVRRAGDQVRINAQLIDAVTGGHMWADRYDGPASDVFELQDRVTQSIVSALEIKLTESEQEDRTRKRNDNPIAYDAFLQGWEYYQRFTADDFVRAIPFFERAIELDPDDGRAHAALASLYWESIRQGEAWNSKVSPDSAAGASTVSRGQSRVKANKHLRLALKNPSPLAYQLSSATRWEYRRFDDAIAEAVKAVSLDPNDPGGHIALAWAMIFNGDPDAALAAVETAMRLDPQNAGGVYLYVLGLTRLGRAQYEDALTALNEARERSPDYLDINLALVIAYAHLERAEHARSTLEEYQATWRNFSTDLEGVLGRWPFRREVDVRRFGNALIKTGFGSQADLDRYIELLQMGGTLE